MKWMLIIGNITAAVGLVTLGEMGSAAHRAHAYSVYRELQIEGVLPERPSNDIPQKLESIGAGGAYSQLMGRCGAAVCVANAIAAAIGFQSPRSSQE
jgi:hypothetical protein